MRTECPELNLPPSDPPGSRVVRLSAELDVATRDHCYSVCTAGDVVDVTVDLGEVTFMDCSGYGTLIAARNSLIQRQGSLEIRNARGQPKRLLDLLDLIDELDQSVRG